MVSRGKNPHTACAGYLWAARGKIRTRRVRGTFGRAGEKSAHGVCGIPSGEQGQESAHGVCGILSGRVVIVTAGTSDLPVAEEARETALWTGAAVELVQDVGVAGPHRLAANLPLLETADAIVVVAGMEGALPSVVGGYVACPVIAVPTSIGYGASFGGIAALLGMLNSCAANVTVVNIDAGFKGGYVAGLIAKNAARPTKEKLMDAVDECRSYCTECSSHNGQPHHDRKNHLPMTCPPPPAGRPQGRFRHGPDRGRIAGHGRGGGLGGHGGPARRRGLVRLAVPEAVPRHGRRLRTLLHDRPAAGRRAHGRIAAGRALPGPHRRARPSRPRRGRLRARAGPFARLDRLVVRLYQEIAKPMVFDADALNALAGEPESLAQPGGPRILTPHPGEFARLVGRKLDGDARNEAAVELAARCACVVVLKGHRTLGDRRPTPGHQHDGQSGHGHRRLGRRVHRPGHRPGLPAPGRSTPPGWASICTAWPATWPPRSWARCR